MMRKLVICITLIIIINIILPTTYAADSTPSADIKSKLEELKKEIASKAALLKQEVGRKLKDKSYIGKVISKSDTSLTLATAAEPKIVSLNKDTVYDSNLKTKTKNPQKNISLENYIAALGDSDETGVLTAKKIVLLPATNNQQPKTFLRGRVISISDNLITIRGKDFKNIAVTLPKLSAVKLNDSVVLSGKKGKNDIFEAGFVYVIPQGAVLKPKNIATSSAKMATPSATIKPISH